MNSRILTLCTLVMMIFLTWAFVLHRGGSEVIESNVLIAKEKQLKMAMFSAETNIECGYSSIEYEYYTPTEAAENLVHLGNLSQEYPPEEFSEYPVPAAIPYVAEKTKHPWEIVVTAVEELNIVRLEGYGLSPEPMFVREVKCL